MISLCLFVLQPSYISDGLHMLPCLLLYQTRIDIPCIAVECYNNLDLQMTHSSELRFVSSSDSSLLWCHLLQVSCFLSLWICHWFELHSGIISTILKLTTNSRRWNFGDNHQFATYVLLVHSLDHHGQHHRFLVPCIYQHWSSIEPSPRIGKVNNHQERFVGETYEHHRRLSPSPAPPSHSPSRGQTDDRVFRDQQVLLGLLTAFGSLLTNLL